MKLAAVLSSLLITAAFSLSANADAVNLEALRYNSSSYPTKQFDPNVLSDRASWISQFQLVIVVNKAESGSNKQSLTIWQKAEPIFRTKVSTGREKWEKARNWFWEHAPRESYFSGTNVGYYTPSMLSANHYSKSWGSRMPWAVFFDGGIAIHQAPDKTEWALGSRASGGCVRVSKYDAPYIFELVQATENAWIPQFTRSGEPVLDANGNIAMQKGYSTLIIVEDRIAD